MKVRLYKAAAGMFAAVLFVCFPEYPGYAAALGAFYYTVEQARPLAAYVYEDVMNDLRGRHA